RTDHWAENRPPCSLRKLPDMLKLPHQAWLTFRGTVTPVVNKGRRDDVLDITDWQSVKFR
ncbi:MAG: hypothetical protein OEW73_14735, partial [Gammaproteobacteria bacterium]|nr:hypothetical protein [Gammaproteobacteria bacterium]